MKRKNNVKCVRELCPYHKGFHSTKFANTKKLPVQCPRCKRYDTVKKI
jgi:hypothetical protein